MSQSRFTLCRLLRYGLGTLAAAVAAPVVVPGRALGRDGLIPPGERIGMGFAGLGGQGSGHLFGGAWTYLPGGYLAGMTCRYWPSAMCGNRVRPRAGSG